MLNSVVLEVAIGLVFCYASVALIVSSINEAISSALKLRSKTLLQGIKSLINDHKFEGFARDIYNHALVNPRAPGTARAEQDIENKPSYIEPKNFAISFIDAVQTIPGNFKQLGEDINAIQDQQLRQLLQGMYAQSSGHIENLHTQLATWFDAGMDRVSGEYKRQSQLYCFLIAFVIAALFNIDSFHLFKTLWEHSAIAAQINVPSNTITQTVADLKKLPIGWQEPNNVGFLTFVGWLVTASTALFGAPFWFDLLQQLTRLRGTGPRPGQPNKTGPSTTTPVTINLASQPSQQTAAEIAGERNAIIDLHTDRNMDDESYRPIQPEERW